MCVSLEMEERYDMCFDKLSIDMGQGYEGTIQYFLLSHGILVKDEYEFKRAFQDFLEECDKKDLISPG